MIIYTDIDQVLFDYAKRFAQAAKERFGVDIGEDFFTPVEADFMSYAQVTLKCSEDELIDTFYIVDKQTTLEPTPYSYLIFDFLNFHHNNRGKIRAVTARSTRTGAQAILETNIGPKIPIFCCSPPYKKYVVTANSIYFEDSPEAAVSTALEHPSTAVVVPAWPWNESLTKTDNGFVEIPNLFRFNVEQMASVLTTFMTDKNFSSYSSWIPEKFRLHCSGKDIFKGSYYATKG